MLVSLAREFGPKNAASPMRGAVRAAVTALKPDVVAGTPVSKGNLLQTVRLQSRFRNGVASAGVGWIVKKGDTARIQAALGVEFGNKRQQPQDILGQLARNNAQRMVNLFVENFEPQWQKAIDRWRRRMAQGKFRKR